MRILPPLHQILSCFTCVPADPFHIRPDLVKEQIFTGDSLFKMILTLVGYLEVVIKLVDIPHISLNFLVIVF